jgi:transposase-like protein
MRKTTRDWTPEAKRQVVQDWLASGLSAYQYAKTHNVAESSLVRWRDNLQNTRETTQEEKEVFVPVRIEDLSVRSPAEKVKQAKELRHRPARSTKPETAIEIQCGRNILRVCSGFDPHTLRDLLQALGAQDV